MRRLERIPCEFTSTRGTDSTRTSELGTLLAPQLTIDPATNRVTGTGFGYDANGNMTADGLNSLGYDAENRMKTGAGVTYTYDGDGKRVAKSNGKLYWYGTGTDPLAESDAAGNITDEYIFFNGKRIARRKLPSGEINYYFSDHLGTSRVVTNATGTTLDDSDFYPFGVERSVTSSSGNAYKFTGKERDSESGLDNFGARYYASSPGRFMSVDPARLLITHLGNPQKLNRYAYVLNNPLGYFDPDGREEQSLSGKFFDSFFVRASVGVGIGVQVKALGTKFQVEASVKSQGKISLAGNESVSAVTEAGVGAQARNPALGKLTLGPHIYKEITTVEDGKAVNDPKTTTEKTLFYELQGRQGSVSKSDVSLLGGEVCAILCVGVDVGFDPNKLGQFFSGAKEAAQSLLGQSQQVAPPPPPPPPDKIREY